MRVFVSNKARADLNEIYDYIALDSIFFATRTINQILQFIEQIGWFPNSGRISTEYNDPSIRERFYLTYRIGYKVFEDRVEIATIRHMSRMIGKVGHE